MIPIEEQNIRSALSEIAERIPDIHVSLKRFVLDELNMVTGELEPYTPEHNYTSAKDVLADPMRTLLGNNGNVKKVLKELADRASSGKVEAYLYAEQILLQNTIGLLTRSGIKLGVLPTVVPVLTKYPYGVGDNEKLKGWMEDPKKEPLTFKVRGEFKAMEKSDMEQATDLFGLFWLDTNPSPDEKQASPIEKFFRSFPVEEWETVVQELSKEGSLLRFERLFYDTKESDPERLRRVLNSIVETIVWDKYVAIKHAVEEAYSPVALELLNAELTKILKDPELSPESKEAKEREVILNSARHAGLQHVINRYESAKARVVRNLHSFTIKYARALAWKPHALAVTWKPLKKEKSPQGKSSEEKSTKRKWLF